MQRDFKTTFMFPSDQSGIAPGQHLMQVTAAWKCKPLVQLFLICTTRELGGISASAQTPT